MLPADKEFLQQVDTFLNSAQYEDLEDFLVLKLGEQPNNITQQLHLDIVQQMQWQLPRIRKFQPRTMLLSMMHYVMQDNQKAKSFYTQCLRRKLFEDKSHILIFNQAMCQNSDTAQFLFSKCLKLKPGFWPALLNYSVLLLRKQRRQQAFLLIDNYARHYPSHKVMQLQYIAASSEDNYHELMKRYRGKRWHWQIGYNLAVYLNKIHKYMEALKAIREVSTVVKDNGRVYLLHGLICQKLKAWSEAKEVYTQALQFYEEKEQIFTKLRKIQRKLTSCGDNLIKFNSPTFKKHTLAKTLRENINLTNRPNHVYSPTCYTLTTERLNIKDRLRKVIDCKRSMSKEVKPIKVESPPESVNVSAIDKKEVPEMSGKFDETLGFSLQNWPNTPENNKSVDEIKENQQENISQKQIIVIQPRPEVEVVPEAVEARKTPETTKVQDVDIPQAPNFLKLPEMVQISQPMCPKPPPTVQPQIEKQPAYLSIPISIQIVKTEESQKTIKKQQNTNKDQKRVSIMVGSVQPTPVISRSPTPNQTLTPSRKVKINTIQFMNQTLDFSQVQKSPLASSKNTPKQHCLNSGQSRSIRQIMVNPHFVKQRVQSIKTFKDIKEKCHLDGITAEVDCLLSKQQHDRALEIYKRQYKHVSTVDQKMNVLLKIAWVFDRSGCQQNAKKTYQKCLKLGCNTRAFLKLGQLELKMGLIESGIDNLEKATCIMRDDEQIRLQLAYGYSMLQAGLPKALAITNQILLRDPTNLRAIMLSSNIHQKLGNIDLALEISNAIDVSHSNQSIKHYIGLLKLQKQDIQGAYQCFRQALKINNKYVPSMVESASILSTDNPSAAVKIFEKALQIQPGNLSALTRLARLYETDLNDNQKAIATYSLALELSQTFQTYQNLGNCYYREKRYKEAIDNFKMAITLNSTGVGWIRVAQCYQHIKMFDKALNYYQLSLTLEPSAETHKRMGLCHINLENFKSAIECFRKAIEMKESAEVFALMANCFYLVEDYDQAIDNYQKSIDLDDKNMSVQYNLAICFDQKQQFLASKTLYQAILQQQPNNVNCLYNLGNIMLVLGKNTEGVQLFQRAIQQQPENYQRRLELIELYETMNDLNRAQSHLLHCYRDNDQDQEVLDKLIRIYKKKKDIKKVNKYQKLLLNLKSASMGGVQGGKATLRSKTQT